MQTIKLMVTALLIGSCLAVGCQSNNHTAEPQSNTPVVLTANQSTRIGQDVAVQVTSIQDSRCPANALCIRYGSAKVGFILANDNEQQTGDLCLGECGKGLKDKDTTAVQLSGTTYRVVLSEIRPYPGTGSPDVKPEAVIQVLK
ncbi:hypothetical protein [Spirosoma validum]|uniref:Lipoprotein n=1 Tax=Spirosoma validum TaxID=2771355 RepID=A0A927B593_9BACT|nr:hypothetical protein [Spirosoma validum]MBD2755593.1 hypothetical protein [Spirosoma validum]